MSAEDERAHGEGTRVPRERSASDRPVGGRHSDGRQLGEPSTKEPSLRQQKVLDAYFRYPVAAAVARELDMSERQVRRIVEEFADHLEARRAQRDGEITARADARLAHLQDWADAAQRQNLLVLDQLISSEDDGIRLRAVKARQDLIDKLPNTAMGTSALDAILAAKEQEAADALRKIELFSQRASEEGAGDD
jgi:hypothetical protein